MLKPVEPEDLEKAIQKAKSINKSQSKSPLDINRLVEMLQSGAVAKPTYKEYFLCSHRNAWVPVKTADIAYFNFDSLIFIYTKSNEKYVVDGDTMDEIESMLNPDKFYRVNRQFIVNIDIISRVWGLENAKLMLKLKEPYQAVEIDISRQKAPIFKKWLEK